MSKTKKTSTKQWISPSGEVVPAAWVPAYDKTRDRIAKRIHRIWVAEQKRLEALREQTDALIDELRAAAAKAHGVTLGGQKGYLQFRSFDGKIIIRFENVAQVEFDERLALAQQLIGEAIEDMAKETSRSTNLSDLRKIAEAAFKPRGKAGKLDRQRVRDIAALNVAHPKWRKAAELIREAEKVIGRKPYVRVLEVPEVEDGEAASQPRPIILDISKV